MMGLVVVVAAGAVLGDTAAPSSACGADSLYTRVPVYILPRVVDRVDTVSGPSLLLIAQAAATRIRTALGAPADSVPRGDSLVGPLRTESGVVAAGVSAREPLDSAGLRVAARRDGTVHWSPIRTTPGPLATLLDHSLGEVVRDGEAFITPEFFVADSIVFTLGYHSAYQTIRGRPVPQLLGPATLVAFTMRVAAERMAAAVPGTIRVTFPSQASERYADGYVVLQFVVDTSGHAEVATAHYVWPKDKPRLTGDVGMIYDALVRAGIDGVVRGRFSPAEVAGCKVRQLVQLPVTFTLHR